MVGVDLFVQYTRFICCVAAQATACMVRSGSGSGGIPVMANDDEGALDDSGDFGDLHGVFSDRWSVFSGEAKGRYGRGLRDAAKKQIPSDEWKTGGWNRTTLSFDMYMTVVGEVFAPIFLRT